MIDNLYRKLDKRTGKVYFSYKDIRNGRFHGLGTDQAQAESDAIALNAAIYASIRSQKLLAIQTLGTTGASLNRAYMHHLAECEKRKLARNTLATRKSQAGAIVKDLGADRNIETITVGDAAKIIKKYEEANKARTARGIRTAGIEVWRDAIAEGWVKDNIWETTRNPPVEVKRSRLTLDAFWAIHKAALTLEDAPWIARSMELALVSAQRREDLSLAEYKHSSTSAAWIHGDVFRVLQQKTGTGVEISMDIELHGLTLREVVRRCRSDNVVSRHLIHQTRNYGNAPAGSPIWKDTMTKGFARARDLAGVTGENGKAAPTFHEIRSLAIREYTKLYGAELAQAIAGHKEAATTDLYRDVRGAEWIKVSLKQG